MLNPVKLSTLAILARYPRLTLRQLPDVVGMTAPQVAGVLEISLVDYWPFADEPLGRVYASSKLGHVSNYPKYKGLSIDAIHDIMFSRDWLYEMAMRALKAGCDYSELDDWIEDEWDRQFKKHSDPYDLRDYVQKEDYGTEPCIVATKYAARYEEDRI